MLHPSLKRAGKRGGANFFLAPPTHIHSRKFQSWEVRKINSWRELPNDGNAWREISFCISVEIHLFLFEKPHIGGSFVQPDFGLFVCKEDCGFK